MAPQITKRRSMEHIRDLKLAAEKIVKLVREIESIRFERDISGTFYIYAGTDVIREFQDADAVKMGFADVGALQYYVNDCLDAVKDVQDNYIQRIAPISNAGEVI